MIPIQNLFLKSYIYERFSDRSIQESFRLRPGHEEKSNNSLNHLACHYYRIYAGGSIKSLKVRLEAGPSGAESRLKAQIAVVSREKQRERIQPLMPASSSELCESILLSAELNDFDMQDIDHLVLIVSNCGFRDATTNHGVNYDEQAYTIHIIPGAFGR